MHECYKVASLGYHVQVNMHAMMNQIFVVINYSMFICIFLLYVTTYVSRGLSTYFGTERTSLLVRR